jgi:hypothetical protein
MNNRPGGKTTKREVSENVEFYPDNAFELMHYLRPHFTMLFMSRPYRLKVLDACSGSGNLGNKFEEIFSSKVDYAEIQNGVNVHDIEEKYDVIICNPPWSLKISLPIYWKLVDLLRPDGILIFIINNVFCYQGSERASELKYQKYYFLPRWTFKHTGRPLLDCGVMVYHKDGIVPDNAARLRPYIPLERYYS